MLKLQVRSLLGLVLVSSLMACSLRKGSQDEGLPTASVTQVPTYFGDRYEKSDLPELGSTGVARLTILATNDIHGGVEPSRYRTTGEPIGGLAFGEGSFSPLDAALRLPAEEYWCWMRAINFKEL